MSSKKLKKFFWKIFHYNDYKRFKKLLAREPIRENIRSGLKFGYYGCTNNQVEETKDHVNLLWEFQWKPIDQVIENIRKAKMDTVLDLYHQLFLNPEPDNIKLDSNSATRVRALFNRLRQEGLLKYIKVLYPIDEPNLPGQTLTEKTIEEVTSLVRSVASEYEELKGVKLGVIYAARHPFLGMRFYDIIGLDDYDKSAEELFFPELGEYDSKIMKYLQPHQKVIVVPGGFGKYKQNPKEFINWASSNEHAYGVVCFIWEGKQFEGGGIKDNGMADIYRKYGKIVISKV